MDCFPGKQVANNAEDREAWFGSFVYSSNLWVPAGEEKEESSPGRTEVLMDK